MQFRRCIDHSKNHFTTEDTGDTIFKRGLREIASKWNGVVQRNRSHNRWGKQHYFDTANIAKGNDETTNSTSSRMTQFLQPSCILSRGSSLAVRGTGLLTMRATGLSEGPFRSYGKGT